MCSSKQQPHRLRDMWIVQYWSVVFKMWFTMFTKHQGHKGHHPSKQLLFKASFKAYITKRSEQLNRVLCYVQQHTSRRSHTQRSRLTQSCLLLPPQLQLPEPSEASGTTWSFFWVRYSSRLAAGGLILPVAQASAAVVGPAKSRGCGRATWGEFVLQVVQWTEGSCSRGRAAGTRRRKRTPTQQRDEGEITQQEKGAQQKPHVCE